jgi:hypothetical protein
MSGEFSTMSWTLQGFAGKLAALVGMRVGQSGAMPKSRRIQFGVHFKPGLEEPAMFRLPAYDPLGIAMLGFGILAVAALAAFAY